MSEHDEAGGRINLRFERRAQGKVARVNIHHPGKLNAMDNALTRALTNCFIKLAGDPDLRAVVLGGEGDVAFAGGAYLNELVALDSDTARTFIIALHDAAASIRALPVPVIGRMRGYCLGAGAEIAAACDFRIADESFVVGMPEVQVGLPSVIEAALLPALIGWGKTREMLLTGANFNAEEAYRMGFVEHLVAADALDDKINEKLDQICAAGALAVRSQKALISKWEELSLSAAIEAGIDHFSDAYTSDEPRRMMAPFFDKK